MTWFYKLNVIDGPLPLVIYGLTVIAIVVLLIRRPTPAWLWRIVVALAVGIGGGVGIVLWVNSTHAFGLGDMPLPSASILWLPAGFTATMLGIVSLWERGVWRKIVALLLVLLALVSTALGVNAAFGVNTTVGSMFGISVEEPIHSLPKPAPTATLDGPLYRTWNPPSDMPAKGTRGTIEIPSGSKFAPRPALLYLPPAALVRSEAPPRLPLIVMMMGKPGTPTLDFIAPVLDEMASKNKGLAPIVIVADQLGPSGGLEGSTPDPACADSAEYGDVDAYFNQVIPKYAKDHLNVLTDPKDWTIMGYSNGGACAFTWAARHPGIWGNIIAISGDEYPGIEQRAQVIKETFGGDEKKFEANKPAAALQSNAGAFKDHLALFTVGGADPTFMDYAARMVQQAKDAGFDPVHQVIPGADHVGGALKGGIPFAMDRLYRRLGLSAP